MKRSFPIIFLGVVIASICCYHAWSVIIALTSTATSIDVQHASGTNHEIESNDRRESITFILGEDKDARNRYYEEATRFYANHPTGKTDYLITTCRSLLEVRNHLQYNKPRNGLPWGLINLVSHGNQWTGLSVKVTSDSKRTTTARIEECTRNGSFLPLPANVLDKKSEIFLHGCGVGNNHALIHAIAIAFGGENSKPIVRAARLFEYYASVSMDTMIQCERYLAKTWFSIYKMGERPVTSELVNELREKYPEASVEWNFALTREQPESVGGLYHYTFEVPVKWVIPVSADSFPELTDEKDQLAWLNDQQQIVTEISTLEIPMEKFAWSFNRVYVNDKSGATTPAVWVKGYCTIICVLQALTINNDETMALQKPYLPGVNDTNYYFSTNASEPLLSEN
jgi:hypothetical protein